MTDEFAFPTYEESYPLSPAQRKAFADLCATPSLPAIRELASPQLEALVAFVFLRAGYGVQQASRDSGYDLCLYAYSSRDESASLEPFAVVQVKGQRTSGLTQAEDIRTFANMYSRNATWRTYCVTTREFTLAAYSDVMRHNNVKLINGERFLRYMAYVNHFSSTWNTASPLPIERIFSADAVPQVLSSKTVMMTIAHNKGGVGKTTLVFNLARALAQEGRRVLTVDMDGQGSLTALLNPNRAGRYTIGDYLQGKATLSDVITTTGFPNIALMPGGPMLDHMDNATDFLAFVKDLREEILGANPPIDWVIFDTPPAMGFATSAALASSHYVLEPMRPDGKSLTAFNNLQRALASTQALMGAGAHLLGVVITMWDGQYEEAMARLRQYFTEHDIRFLGTVDYFSSTRLEHPSYAKVVAEVLRTLGEHQ